MSLKCMIDKWLHKGQISQEEYDAVIKKLDGHDKELLDKVAEKIKDCSYEIYSDISPYPETVVDMEDIDSIIAEMKAEVKE